MGFEDEAEQSITRPYRQIDDRSKRTCELTSSIVPRGTSFHRWVELGFSPIAFDSAWFFMLLHSKKWSWLKAWAMQVARRRGMKKAIVALARRLAVIMHRIWVDGTEFRWTRDVAAA